MCSGFAGANILCLEFRVSFRLFDYSKLSTFNSFASENLRNSLHYFLYSNPMSSRYA